MERVTGVGGFFFPASDPARLIDWYEEHLGIPRATGKYEDGSWWQDAGPTVFHPYASADRSDGDRWTLNLRVRDLDAMIVQLEAAGIEVQMDPNVYPNGRFARIRDPEGNPIELWEPAGPDLRRPGRLEA